MCPTPGAGSQPEFASHDRRAAVSAGPSALGDGVPAQVRGLSQPDRALVEDPALAGVGGPAVRDLGGDRRGDPPLHDLLECATPSLRRGHPPPASAPAIPWHRPPAEGRMTYRMHHLVGPEQPTTIEAERFF